MNPFGPYGNLVASALGVIIVLAAVASHIIPGVTPNAWLDNLGLLVAGVVFGTQVVQNGTQGAARQALALAQEALALAQSEQAQFASERQQAAQDHTQADTDHARSLQ